jgi:hypothetical protein
MVFIEIIILLIYTFSDDGAPDRPTAQLLGWRGLVAAVPRDCAAGGAAAGIVYTPTPCGRTTCDVSAKVWPVYTITRTAHYESFHYERCGLWH